MSDTLKPSFVTTPETHGQASGHWDVVSWDEGYGRPSQLHFQNGPVREHGVNGVQIDDVLKVCLARLKMLNKSFPCRENSLSITNLQLAIMWQQERTAKRTSQGVEGYDKPHKDEDVA